MYVVVRILNKVETTMRSFVIKLFGTSKLKIHIRIVDLGQESDLGLLFNCSMKELKKSYLVTMGGRQRRYLLGGQDLL